MTEVVLQAVVGVVELTIAIAVALNLQRFEAFMRLMYRIVRVDVSKVPSPPIGFPIVLAFIGAVTLISAFVKWPR